jgi:hypothetical protein
VHDVGDDLDLELLAGLARLGLLAVLERADVELEQLLQNHNGALRRELLRVQGADEARLVHELHARPHELGPLGVQQARLLALGHLQDLHEHPVRGVLVHADLVAVALAQDDLGLQEQLDRAHAARAPHQPDGRLGVVLRPAPLLPFVAPRDDLAALLYHGQQKLVGLLDLLEHVPAGGVLVGVVLPRQAPVALSELLAAVPSLQPEHLPRVLARVLLLNDVPAHLLLPLLQAAPEHLHGLGDGPVGEAHLVAEVLEVVVVAEDLALLRANKEGR